MKKYCALAALLTALLVFFVLLAAGPVHAGELQISPFFVDTVLCFMLNQ